MARKTWNLKHLNADNMELYAECPSKSSSNLTKKDFQGKQ